MNDVFVLDACSLIALLTNENGADVVKDILQKAIKTDADILMHKVNFLEVYYCACSTTEVIEQLYFYKRREICLSKPKL